MSRKQKELAGMETASAIPELDAAAERFKDLSKKRKRAQDAELEAREIVVHLMRSNKLTVYEDRDADLIVTLTPGKETVKVEELDIAEERKANAKDDDEGEEPDAAALAKLEGKASKKGKAVEA